MAEVTHDADGDHTRIAVTEARGGRWGRHVFWVLVASTFLAAVVLFASWGLRSGDLSKADATQTPPAVATSTPTQTQAADPGPTTSPAP